jgi:hypothetical protein
VDQLPLVLEPWLLPIADALDNEEQRRENEAIERAKKQQKAAKG